MVEAGTPDTFALCGRRPGRPPEDRWAGEPVSMLIGQAEVIAHQLEPVRTRAILVESFRREAWRAPAVRLAFAMV